MTGEKLAKELMEIRPDIPIILCTGYSERITEEKAKEIGIKAFVMKPLVMRDLAKTVRKALRIDDWRLAIVGATRKSRFIGNAGRSEAYPVKHICLFCLTGA